MIPRRQFIAGALGALAAKEMKAAACETAVSDASRLLQDRGVYGGFGPGETWIQVAPDIGIDSSRFGASFGRTLRMTSANGSPARAECALGAPPSRLLQVDVYVEDPASCARFDLQLSSNGFTGWIAIVGINPTLTAGWNRLQFSINDCSAQGAGMTMADWDNVTRARFVFISRPGASTTIYIRQLLWLKTRAAVTFTWDDGRAGCYTKAMPMMAQYGWTSTIYVVTDAVGRSSYQFAGGGAVMTDPLTLDDLKALQDAGWDVSSHSCTHPDLTQLSTEQKHYELAASHDWLIANGFSNGARFFATPYGKRDPEVQAFASNIYENLRDGSSAPTAGWETPLSMQWALNTRYQLRFKEIISLGRTPFPQFQSWVDAAIASGAWLIIMGHSVDDPSGWLSPDLFRRYLMYLDSKRDQIDVLPMSAYWDRRNQFLAAASGGRDRSCPTPVGTSLK